MRCLPLRAKLDVAPSPSAPGHHRRVMRTFDALSAVLCSGLRGLPAACAAAARAPAITCPQFRYLCHGCGIRAAAPRGSGAIRHTYDSIGRRMLHTNTQNAMLIGGDLVAG